MLNVALKHWRKSDRWQEIQTKLLRLYQLMFLERQLNKLNSDDLAAGKMLECETEMTRLTLADNNFVVFCQQADSVSQLTCLLPFFHCGGKDGVEELLGKITQKVQQYSQFEPKFHRALFDAALKSRMNDDRYPLIKEKLLTVFKQIYLLDKQERLNLDWVRDYQTYKQIADKWVDIYSLFKYEYYWPRIKAVINILKQDYPYAILDKELNALVQKNAVAIKQWEVQRLPESHWWSVTKDAVESITKFAGLISTFSPRCAKRGAQIVRNMLETPSAVMRCSMQ